MVATSPVRPAFCIAFMTTSSWASTSAAARASRASLNMAKLPSHVFLHCSLKVVRSCLSPTAPRLNTSPAARRALWCSVSSDTSSGGTPSLNVARYASSAAYAAARHSASATPCHAVEMVGTAPSLMALTYASASPASMGPLTSCVPIRLGRALARTREVSSDTPFVNSGLSSPCSRVSSSLSCASSATGRTSVKQSLSGKRALMEARMAFLASTAGPLPPDGISAVSR
mmetsp:Transcript_32011/g.71134  ORF Transcript_32011/g.71134 Transcript_32011/m.71134 type:complete len:229 (+) Transcript_32011:607-1293(+)